MVHPSGRHLGVLKCVPGGGDPQKKVFTSQKGLRSTPGGPDLLKGEPGRRARRASANVVSGGGVGRAAATKAGFNPSNETTHGMSTQELREKLAAAGIGARPANAGDFGF